LVRIFTEAAWGTIGGDFWDVGAHRGYTSLLYAKHSSGKAIAFEPDATNLAHLTENLKANPKLSNSIEVIPVAVTDRDGQVDLESPQDDLSQCQIRGNDVAPRQRRFDVCNIVSVPALSLDSVLSHGRTPPRVIKIDVEGAEYLVLCGARTLLQRFHPLVLLEYHNTDAQRKCAAALSEMGYSILALDGRRLRDKLPEKQENGHFIAVYHVGNR
jgi:FkbM family methyltransferase